MLQMIYQSVVASVFYAAVWGGSIRHKDARQLGKLLGGREMYTENVRGHSEQPPESST